MNRGLAILAIGLLVGGLGFAGGLLARTRSSRSVAEGTRPELSWMKEEYHLTQAQYEKIASLHASYLPKCMAMCKKIEEKTAALERLLLTTNTVTTEIKEALRETARVREECQTQMLEHFYEISRVMPAGQGQRYFQWVQNRTLMPGNVMVSQLSPPK